MTPHEWVLNTAAAPWCFLATVAIVAIVVYALFQWRLE